MFEKLLSIFGGEPSPETQSTKSDKQAESEEKSAAQRARESDILIDPELLEGRVNTERRSEIIYTHHDDVTEDEATLIAELLKTNMEGYELEKREAKKRLEEETDLDRDRVETIWWTERFSIQMLNSLNEDSPLDMEYSWSTAGDNAVHPICEAISSEIDRRGGSVSLDELKSVLHNKAKEFEDEGGTPERVDHLVPHEKCRSVILSHPK